MKLPQGMHVTAIVFSIVVFVIWSFIPVIGYGLAKVCGAKGNLSKWTLFALGILVASVEKLVLDLDWLVNGQQYIGVIATSLVFLCLAFVKTTNKRFAI